MKWIKHTTSCSNDPKIRAVIAEFGPHGYAAYWLIIEQIAAEFDGNSRTHFLKNSEKFWKNITFFSQNKFLSYISFCKKIGLFDHQIDGKEITIFIPNLLKYGDEFTRKVASKNKKNSGQTPDKLRIDSGLTPFSSTSTSPSPSPREADYSDSTAVGGAGAGHEF